MIGIAPGPKRLPSSILNDCKNKIKEREREEKCYTLIIYRAIVFPDMAAILLLIPTVSLVLNDETATLCRILIVQTPKEP